MHAIGETFYSNKCRARMDGFEVPDLDDPSPISYLRAFLDRMLVQSDIG